MYHSTLTCRSKQCAQTTVTRAIHNREFNRTVACACFLLQYRKFRTAKTRAPRKFQRIERRRHDIIVHTRKMNRRERKENAKQTRDSNTTEIKMKHATKRRRHEVANCQWIVCPLILLYFLKCRRKSSAKIIRTGTSCAAQEAHRKR